MTSAAIAMLAGCGGSQLPTSAPGVMSQGGAIATYTDRRGSRIEPGGARGDLIYVLQGASESGGEIIAYPSGDVVGYFGFPQPHFSSYDICSDSKGNVFATVAGVSGGFIDEFAHGGTAPIATLIVPGVSNYAGACSADPTTGNLAVVEGAIAIYRHARGSPHQYNDPSVGFYSCAYDDHGNLFAVGTPLHGGYFALVELPKGKGAFANISLDKKLGSPNSIQWDGKNLAIEAQTLTKGQLGRYVVYRVQVSGSKAKILGTTRFKDWRRPGRSTVLDGVFVAVYGADAKSIGYWRYPSGGRAYQVVNSEDWSRLGALTISVAPSR
jgi:hypothetical protein